MDEAARQLYDEWLENMAWCIRGAHQIRWPGPNQLIGGNSGIESEEAFGSGRRPGPGRPREDQVWVAAVDDRTAIYLQAERAMSGALHSKIAAWAGVGRKELNEWKNGQLSDKSKTSKLIEERLREIIANPDKRPF